MESLVLMLTSPPQGSAAQQLGAELSVPIRILQRWRRWWAEEFLRMPFCQAVRSRFMPPLLITQLPARLLESV